jgi:hypothetical protein
VVVYVMPPFTQYDALLKKLGKHKTGVSCLYLGYFVREEASRYQSGMTCAFPVAASRGA